jgi:nucleotide-binding universal stress UspA family protein
MAVVTTMVMPPSLRWMMARLPLGEEELQRLDKEDAEQSESVPHMERTLVYLDDSVNGVVMASLAGLFVARQGVLTTVLEAPAQDGAVGQGLDRLMAAAKTALRSSPGRPLQQLVQARAAGADDALEKEALKGYSIAFVGIDQPISLSEPRFDGRLERLVSTFDGPVAMLVNGEALGPSAGSPRDILVPATGDPESRLATEIALALAAATRGSLTVFHVFDPQEDTLVLRGRARRFGMSVLVNTHRLGKRTGVPVKGLTATNAQPEAEIRRAVARGGHDLLVMGTSLRRGEAKFLGPRALALVRSLGVPVLLVAR